MWNPDDLAAFPSLVRGVDNYKVDPKSDYGRLQVFYNAAASHPPIHRSLNAASSSKYSDVLPCELWWVDGSHKFELNTDKDCRMFFFIEHVTGYPFISFHPDKSTDSFIKGLKALVERVRKLSDNKIRLLKGDFDTAWAVQGRPDFILTSKVQEVCTALIIDFNPVAPYCQSMN